jgi:hypothetical protein
LNADQSRLLQQPAEARDGHELAAASNLSSVCIKPTMPCTEQGIHAQNTPDAGSSTAELQTHCLAKRGSVHPPSQQINFNIKTPT